MILRINHGVAQAVGHPDFAHQVGVAIPFRDADESGFPGPLESNELAQIEDDLASALEANRLCLYAASITTGGMREFVFYTSDPDQTRALIETYTKTITGHELQLIIRPDPKWDVYKSFA